MSTDTRRPKIEWDLRVPTAEQLPAYLKPVQMAFAEPTSGPEAEDWVKTLEPDRWIGAFESPSSEIAAGGAAAYSVRLTVPGGEVEAAAVTGVGVRSDQRRRGILSALMRRQLDDIHERGEPVAILWASEAVIYQRFGYGLATRDGCFEIATGRTSFARQEPDGGRVRIVSEEESMELIPAVYDAMHAVTPGAISRPQSWWSSFVLSDPEYARHGASEKFRIVYETGGRAEGYAVYRIKNDWDHQGPKGKLEVSEAVTNTPRALRGIWRYLFDVDLVRSVRASRAPIPNPLQLVLAEPRALGLIANDGLWARLVDLPAALMARRYGTVDSLVLELSDDFCDWNAGRWRLTTTGEPGLAEADVVRSEDAPDLVLDTTELAAVYLGGTDPADLATAGRIEERTVGAVRRIAAMFAAERTPWCVAMF